MTEERRPGRLSFQTPGRNEEFTPDNFKYKTPEGTEVLPLGKSQGEEATRDLQVRPSTPAEQPQTRARAQEPGWFKKRLLAWGAAIGLGAGMIGAGVAQENSVDDQVRDPRPATTQDVAPESTLYTGSVPGQSPDASTPPTPGGSGGTLPGVGETPRPEPTGTETTPPPTETPTPEPTDTGTTPPPTEDPQDPPAGEGEPELPAQEPPQQPA